MNHGGAAVGEQRMSHIALRSSVAAHLQLLLQRLGLLPLHHKRALLKKEKRREVRPGPGTSTLADADSAHISVPTHKLLVAVRCCAQRANHKRREDTNQRLVQNVNLLCVCGGPRL